MSLCDAKRILALQEHAPENLRYAIPLRVVTVNEWVLAGRVRSSPLSRVRP
jgi:hypothetical protein